MIVTNACRSDLTLSETGPLSFFCADEPLAFCPGASLSNVKSSALFSVDAAVSGTSRIFCIASHSEILNRSAMPLIASMVVLPIPRRGVLMMRRQVYINRSMICQ